MSADLDALRVLSEAATPGPWFYTGYSAIHSKPMLKVDDEFWTDERMADGHTYDHRVGQTCPECGERPAINEKTGERFGTYWDCARHKDAHDVDPVVSWVPAQYGDTATGKHAIDAEFIAAAVNYVRASLADSSGEG